MPFDKTKGHPAALTTKKYELPNASGGPNSATHHAILKGFLGASHIGSESGPDIPMLTTVEKVSLTSLRESSSLHEDKGYDDSVSSVTRTPSRNDSSPELGTPFTVTEVGTSSISRSKLGSPPAANSWLGSLFATIIGILKISISNVHIRYEDSIINPGHPFSSGVILGKLAAATMDEPGMKTSTPMMP